MSPFVENSCTSFKSLHLQELSQWLKKLADNPAKDSDKLALCFRFLVPRVLVSQLNYFAAHRPHYDHDDWNQNCDLECLFVLTVAAATNTYNNETNVSQLSSKWRPNERLH